MFKLEGFIKPENVFFNLNSGSKRGVLKETVARVCEVEGIKDKEEELLGCILNREKVESTGIGQGFAIPHCHYDHFQGVKVFVAFPKEPIDFKSMDGSLVRAIFMIISDNKSNEIYLKTLSRLMYLFRNVHLRDQLFSLTKVEQFIELIQASDQQLKYISFSGLKEMIKLLELENEIETYSHEILVVEGKRKGKANLKEDSQYLKLQADRDLQVKKIDQRLLSIYKQLKHKYNGEILSRVYQNVCGYCNVQLPVHIIREIKRQNQIIQCNTCAKILILR